MTTWQRLDVGSSERRLCIAMNRWGARHTLACFFGLVSRVGDGLFWYAVIAFLAIFGGMPGLHAALHMTCVGLVAAFLYRTLKCWTRRPRPFRVHSGITAYIAPLDEFSFPSGHTLHAVSFTLIALTYFPLLASLLIPFTVLVAMSRIVLGLHYPSDVLAATGIGGALAGVSIWIAPAAWLA